MPIETPPTLLSSLRCHPSPRLPSKPHHIAHSPSRMASIFPTTGRLSSYIKPRLKSPSPPPRLTTISVTIRPLLKPHPKRSPKLRPLLLPPAAINHPLSLSGCPPSTAPSPTSDHYASTNPDHPRRCPSPSPTAFIHSGKPIANLSVHLRRAKESCRPSSLSDDPHPTSTEPPSPSPPSPNLSTGHSKHRKLPPLPSSSSSTRDPPSSSPPLTSGYIHLL